MPIAALLLLLYPLCKRFTWAAHFVLGAVDGLAPLGAYIAIAGTDHAAGDLAVRRGDDLGRGLRHHLRADGSARRSRHKAFARCRRSFGEAKRALPADLAPRRDAGAVGRRGHAGRRRLRVLCGRRRRRRASILRRVSLPQRRKSLCHQRTSLYLKYGLFGLLLADDARRVRCEATRIRRGRPPRR